MIAQGPWKAWPRRLDAIVADGHPVPDLKYVEIHPLPCPSVGHLEIFCLAFFVSYVFNICVGSYVVIVQGPWKAWPRRLDAIVADGHPIPDLKYFEVQPPALPLGGST